ncbi:hypothetical protein TYRP_020715 [Tyrophagus putrescentiae]|nr:hypothetical protein TYRP_020715 [Tyrophagus putrescentiae]
MSEKNKTSDQLKRVEAHFADLRLRVQKFKAKLERVNIDNGGRVLTVDQVTMLHDAYGFSWSLYAHTLSLEKEWPTQVLDAVQESVGLPPKLVKKGKILAAENAGESEEDY